jgi:hypothetical protein
MTNSILLKSILNSRDDIWRLGDETPKNLEIYKSGLKELDTFLPNGGWPQIGLIEIIVEHYGLGELQLLMPLMRNLTNQDKILLWICPPYKICTSALLNAGIDIEKLLIISSEVKKKDALWAAEQALQTQEFGIVLLWQNHLKRNALHRLLLATKNNKTLGVLFKKEKTENSQSSMILKLEASSRKGLNMRTKTRKMKLQILKINGSLKPKRKKTITEIIIN